MNIFKNQNYQQKLDTVKILLSFVASTYYRYNKSVTNGFLFAMYSMIIPNNRLSKNLLYWLENSNKVVLWFNLKGVGKRCEFEYEITTLNECGWEQLEIDERNWNGLCIIWETNINKRVSKECIKIEESYLRKELLKKLNSSLLRKY